MTGSALPHLSSSTQDLAWCLAHIKFNKYISNELTKESGQTLEATPMPTQRKTQKDIEIWEILN